MNKIQGKKIPNAPNYIATYDGRIYNLKKKRFEKYYYANKKRLYYKVDIYMNGIKKKKVVHRLICSAWHNNTYNYKTVDHINRNSLDNRPINLRWASIALQRKNTNKYINNIINKNNNFISINPFSVLNS
jgi:hypothetical protein